MAVRNEDGELREDIKDAISELGNICIGNTGRMLGNMLKLRIFMSPPVVMNNGAELLESFSHDADKVAVGVLMSFKQSVESVMLFIVEKQFVIEAAATMTGEEYSDLSFMKEEDGLSAVQELANLMAASFINEMGSFIGEKLFLTPMMVGVDMVGALISFPVASLELSDRDVVCVDVKFSISREARSEMTTAGHLILIHDEANVARLVNALGLQ